MPTVATFEPQTAVCQVEAVECHLAVAAVAAAARVSEEVVMDCCDRCQDLPRCPVSRGVDLSLQLRIGAEQAMIGDRAC